MMGRFLKSGRKSTVSRAAWLLANASTSAFKQYLYKDLGLPIMKKRRKPGGGRRCRHADVKEWVRRQPSELARLFELIQEYRAGQAEKHHIDGYLTHVIRRPGVTIPTLCRSERRQDDGQGTPTFRTARARPTIPSASVILLLPLPAMLMSLDFAD